MEHAKILVVDDDPGTRVFLESLLRVEGYAVHQAADGDAGLAAARLRRPDIVIADVEMPGLRGPQLCAALRADENLKDTYVIMLTSHDATKVKLQALLSGADDFVGKPARPGDLLGRVAVARRVLAAEGALRSSQEGRDRSAALLRSLQVEVRLLEESLDTLQGAVHVRDPRSISECLEAGRTVLRRISRVVASAPAPA